MNPHEKPTGRQHALKKPCAECPFSRAAPNEIVKPKVDPMVLIGQAWGPFALPCHCDADYRGAHDCSNVAEISQCAGGATFRSNVGRAGMMPVALHVLPPDKELVFATPAELLAKFWEIPLVEAEHVLRLHPPEDLMEQEMADARAKFFRAPKPQ